MSEQRIDAIKIGDRYRTHPGDLKALADSIDTLGMIHPVVVTPNDELVAGGRRIEAAKLLGWETIPVTVIHTLGDAGSILEAQCDENICRQDFLPTEAAAIRAAIEKVLKPLVEERMKSGVEQPGPNLGQGKTSRIAAKNTGFSHTTLDKVDKVIEIANDETAAPVVRDTARDALVEMDNTGKVDRPFKRAVGVKNAAERNPLHDTGNAQSVQDASYLHEFSKALCKAQDLVAFDAERIAQLADQDLIESINGTRNSITSFAAAIAEHTKIRRIK
jgi:hypothetical protein